MISLLAKRKLGLGIAIGPKRVLAVRLDNRCAEKMKVVDLPDLAGPSLVEVSDNLETAFRAIAESLHVPLGSQCWVSLLPPLVGLRVLSLPPMADDQLTRGLSRNARRYFPTTWDSPVIGAHRLEHTRDRPGPVLVAAAPRNLVEAVYDASAAIGWHVGSVIPAHAAWAAGVADTYLAPSGDRNPESGPANEVDAIVLLEHAIEILHLKEGRLTELRRIPSRWTDSRLTGILARPLEDRPDVEGERQGKPRSYRATVIGPETERQSIARALMGLGIEISMSSTATPEENEPTSLAAMWASCASGPRLVPEKVRLSSVRRSRRSTVILSGLAAGCLVLAAMAHLLGLKRELDAVAARRVALASEVQAALVEGDALITDVERMVALAELERDASRWSFVVPEVAEYLPRSAYLESFTGRADTLLLAGIAERAASVFEELKQVPQVVDIEAQGPIRREEAEDGVHETFTLSANISRLGQ